MLLSALDTSEALSAQTHLSVCAVCKLRWQELNVDKQRFEQFVFARTLPKVEWAVEQSGHLRSPFTFRWLMPALGLVTALGVAFVFYWAISGEVSISAH